MQGSLIPMLLDGAAPSTIVVVVSGRFVIIYCAVAVLFVSLPLVPDPRSRRALRRRCSPAAASASLVVAIHHVRTYAYVAVAAPLLHLSVS